LIEGLKLDEAILRAGNDAASMFIGERVAEFLNALGNLIIDEWTRKQQ
jgi:hypothetical protein